MAKLISLLFFLLFNFVSFSQKKEKDFINITQKEGLPSNETYCVFKDSKNYIWIATDQGVVRYKGNSMQVINSLPDNVVFKIREDDFGRIWFFSHTGKLAYFFKEKIYPFLYNDSIVKYIKNITINDGYISKQNEVTLVSVSGFANYKINDRGIILKDNKIKSSMGSDTTIFSINAQNGSRLFIQNENPFLKISSNLQISLTNYNKGIVYNYKCNSQKNELFGAILINKNKIAFWVSNSILVLNKDGSYLAKEFDRKILSAYYDTANNSLMLGLSKDGITILDQDLNILKEHILNNYSVSSIEKDFEGDYWYCTLENGVYHTNNFNLNKNCETICELPAQRILNVDDRFLLFANKDGIFKLINNRIEPYVKEKNISVADLQINKENNILYSRIIEQSKNKSYSFVLNRFFHHNLFTNSSNEILQISSTAVIINFGIGLIKLQLTKKGNKSYEDSKIWTKSFNDFKITTLLAKDTNTLFLGTKNSLVIYNILTQKFNLLSDSSHLFSKGITCMRQMQNGIYALGIRFGGLALMKDSTVIANITEADGLLSNSIKYILPVGNNLWLATPNGISVVQISSYQPIKYTITNFGENMGLNNLIIYQLITFKNNIVAATSKGIFQISNVDELLKQAPQPIPLYITTINYFKGDTTEISNLILPYQHSRVVVNFDAICYNTPNELKYFYRLINNSDTIWHNIATTQIVLEKLNPGNYQLQIKAEMAKQHRYSTIQTLVITVNKPWWQLNLIRAAAFLLLLSSVYLIYKWRINIFKKRETEKTFLKTQVIELEQTALRSQMNPHFIFNCLSSIQQLIVAGNVNDANDYLVKFSQLIRKTLEISSQAYVSIANEKNYLTEYISLEQLRLPNKFTFNFIIDENINIYNIEIPNMMLQPIIENSIRHGIKHLQNRKGEIDINIYKKSDCISCEITDNGVGRKKIMGPMELTLHKSYGMNIVQKRLRALSNFNNDNYFVKVIDIVDDKNLPQGTKVILQLPFKINNL